MPSEIKIVKLINGDEVIGFVQDGREKSSEADDLLVDHLIFIKGPMQIIQEYDKTSRGHGVFLIHWIPSGRSNIFSIPKDKIITIDYPKETVEDHYLELMADTLAENEIDAEEEYKQAIITKLKNHKFSDDDIQ